MTGNRIPIQRGDHYRQHLAKHGLGSKIMLSSDIDEFQNICRNMMFFFSNSFGHKNFRFQILQPTGGFNKSLTISQVSHQYKWFTSSMAGKKGKVPILAQEPSKVCTVVVYYMKNSLAVLVRVHKVGICRYFQPNITQIE